MNKKHSSSNLKPTTGLGNKQFVYDLFTFGWISFSDRVSAQFGVPPRFTTPA